MENLSKHQHQHSQSQDPENPVCLLYEEPVRASYQQLVELLDPRARILSTKEVGPTQDWDRGCHGMFISMRTGVSSSKALLGISFQPEYGVTDCLVANRINVGIPHHILRCCSWGKGCVGRKEPEDGAYGTEGCKGFLGFARPGLRSYCALLLALGIWPTKDRGMYLYVGRVGGAVLFRIRLRGSEGGCLGILARDDAATLSGKHVCFQL